MEASGGINQWVGGVERWMADLQREVVAFPDTLRQFREGVYNFQKITKRLADATIALEAMTPSMEALKQFEDTARAVQHSVANAPGAELVGSALEELSKRLTGAAEKNPFMRRPPEPR